MKKMKSGQSAPIISGVKNKCQNAVSAVILAMILSGVTTIGHAQATDGGAALAANTSDSTQAVSRGDPTNTPVAQIQANLDRIKSEIVTSVKQMQEAVASTPQQQVEKVANLAKELRELATRDLADSSEIVKSADGLIAKMKAQVEHARAGSSDPKIGSREIYAAVLTKLEPELGKIIDARASVNRIRSQLLEKADVLDQNATAIGFAADTDQTVLAANAFRDVLSDIVKFTSQIEVIIDGVGKTPIT